MKTVCIGVTGYLGAGKSTVTGILATLSGWFPVNLDTLGHEAYLEKKIREQVIDHFGEKIVDTEGHINRKAIGAVVYASKSEKKWLETLIWPYIINKAKQLIAEHRECILDGFILIPSGLFRECCCVLLVQSCKELLLHRAFLKGYTHPMAESILCSQQETLWEGFMPQSSQPLLITVDNDGSYQELNALLRSIWEHQLRTCFGQDKAI